MHVLGVHGAETAAGTHRKHRRRLTWRRLPILLELITLGAAYGAPSLVRVVLTTTKSAAFGHALQLYRGETALGLNIEPWLNHLVAPHDLTAVAVGYYYGLLHFILTPLTLAWLYWYRPRAFPRLRSALVLSTIGANIVFWTWPVAPPRFAIPGLVDILTTHNVLDSADPHGVTGAANLYAALPSLHVCWATWCAVAVVTATRSRWRYLAWLYPAATTFVVLASANHFVFDVAGGVAVTLLGLAVSRISLSRNRHPAPVPVSVPVPAGGAGSAAGGRDAQHDRAPDDRDPDGHRRRGHRRGLGQCRRLRRRDRRAHPDHGGRAERLRHPRPGQPAAERAVPRAPATVPT